MPGPSKQAPPPLQVDTARVVLAGTALWAVALVVLLLLGDRVDRMWTWTCVAAIGLALLGLVIMRLQGQLPRRDRRHDQPEPAAVRSSTSFVEGEVDQRTVAVDVQSVRTSKPPVS